MYLSVHCVYIYVILLLGSCLVAADVIYSSRPTAAVVSLCTFHCFNSCCTCVCVFVFITMWGRPLTHMLWGPKYNVGTKGPHKAECYKLRSRLLVFVNPYSNIYHTMFLNCFTTCWPTNNNIYNTSSSWQLTKECSLFTRVQESIITFTFIRHQQQFGVQYLA